LPAIHFPFSETAAAAAAAASFLFPSASVHERFDWQRFTILFVFFSHPFLLTMSRFTVTGKEGE
jgi:hypothetical protein